MQIRNQEIFKKRMIQAVPTKVTYHLALIIQKVNLKKDFCLNKQ